MNMVNDKILEVKNLNVIFGKKNYQTFVAQDISFSLYKGETLGIVGESGCGKSTSVLALMGLLDEKATMTGTIVLNDSEYDLAKMKYSDWRKIRGSELAMVFQDSLASLNPLKRIGEQVAEAIYVKKIMNKKDARAEALKLLELVEIPNAKVRFRQYPHECSGGMRQRVMIAMALANKPDVLICDEPTTALDVTVQAQILHTIKSLQNEFKMAVILVTHDLGVISSIANRTHVMYGGKIVESGLTRNIIENPKHQYTNALIKAMPDMVSSQDELFTIPGFPVKLNRIFDECPYGPRCSEHSDECDEGFPETINIEDREGNSPHWVACVNPVAKETSKV